MAVRFFPTWLRRPCLQAWPLALAISLVSCSQGVPQELVEAIDRLDQELVAHRAAEFTPDEYTRFVKRWITLKGRLQTEEDLIRWPWEPNHFETELRQLREEGVAIASEVARRRDSQRATAEDKLTRIEQRLLTLNQQISEIEGRMVLGNKLLETDLLVKQARTFLTEGQFDRSLRMSDLASKLLLAQTTVLTTELGRYSDEARIEAWKIMAKRTVDWTKTTGAPGIVISKAERTLTLYKHGRKVLAYPVRLGYNGIREKRYQGDGATPEGEYRVLRKRGAGQTQFYRALVLNYPNASDRRRFREARKAGYIPGERGIGGQIEIHGVEYELMAQTLGCVMLDNRQMAKLFDLVEVGTPVTIVGALHSNNAVALALTNLSEQEEET